MCILRWFLVERLFVSLHMNKCFTFCSAAKFPRMSSVPKSRIPLPVHEVASSETQSIGSSKGLCKGRTGYSVVYIFACLINFVFIRCVFVGPRLAFLC